MWSTFDSFVPDVKGVDDVINSLVFINLLTATKLALNHFLIIHGFSIKHPDDKLK